MNTKETFRKVQTGVYAGAGVIISRTFDGGWKVSRRGERLMHATTLAACKKWATEKAV
jgi:hypothetical protein